MENGLVLYVPLDSKGKDFGFQILPQNIFLNCFSCGPIILNVLYIKFHHNLSEYSEDTYTSSFWALGW
jgi:hypothetical protein